MRAHEHGSQALAQARQALFPEAVVDVEEERKLAVASLPEEEEGVEVEVPSSPLKLPLVAVVAEEEVG